MLRFRKAAPEPAPDLPWWRLYPAKSRTIGRKPVGARPDFREGQMVRLVRRPDRARRVLSVEWHPFMREFCYYVETSTSRAGAPCPAYWFAPQLQAVPEPVGTSSAAVD